MKKIAYVALLGILVYLTYSKALQFTFWKDDWFYLWNSLYDSRILTPILLHPGTYAELYLFRFIFGTQAFLWQQFGLLLKIATSLGIALMAYGVTRSKLTAILSGMFFATTAVGLESAVWVSAHVTNLALLFLSLAVYFFTEHLHSAQKQKFIFFSVFLTAGLITDPVRALPIIPLLYFLWFVSLPVARRPSAGHLATGLLCIVALSVLGAYVFRGTLWDTPIGRYTLAHRRDPASIVKQIRVIGPYFNSLSNLVTNWFMFPKHYVNEASHGIYDRLGARLGFIVLSGLTGLTALVWRKDRRMAYRMAFFLLWMTLFYVPNWLSEPRIIATGNHRYLTLSNAGFLCLLAYLLSNTRVRYGLMYGGIFVGLNVFSAHQRLEELSAYRSAATVDAVWNQISEETSTSEGPKIFMLTGEEPADTNVFVISGAVPFAVKRKLSKRKYIPIVTNDPAVAARILCISAKESLDSVYAWEIHNDGSLLNRTSEERLAVQQRMSSRCPLKSYTSDR